MATRLDRILSNKTYVLTEMYERLSTQSKKTSNYVTVGNVAGMTSSLSDLIGSDVLTKLREKLPDKIRGYSIN